MSVVNITNVTILEPQGHFMDPYKFEITFECLSQLDDDLEFKLVYVGSAENTTLDQELDSLLVGPVPVGVNKFVFEADAPQVHKLPKEDIIGVTVILLTCSYKTKEFVRIGYYVDNAYK
ncbi:anti-silencing protein [Linderina pennispora]|uniref:Anti-silencing function protein 1 n=1 Tax=Linderina pennispora TaxID=61395 RepID=A0A1Y1WJP0_9FUNG|nr:anti-silencing protein [Linderina pennispora]ORX73759.1 anti-silencing protein [Linderina pennispora]